MGFVDYIKNVFKRNKKDDEEETVDLKHANLESTESGSVDVSDEDLSDEDNEEAVKIEKAGSFQKAADKKTAAQPQQSAAKKVNMMCGSCNYKFTRAEDNIPRMCPYCGKDL